MGTAPWGQIFRFSWKALLLGLPLIVGLGVIVLDDPFKVIWRYEFGDYYNDQSFELNRDYVSTEMLLRLYRKASFNTFILGSSRSFPYHCDELEKLLTSSHAFHYPGAAENLYGLYCKVKLLDRLGVRMDHVLIVTDAGALGDVDRRQDHLHILHPKETGDSWLHFQGVFLRACFSDLFIVKYIDYKLFGRKRPYMRGIFEIVPGDIRIDPVSNDYFFEAEERLLATDSDGFYRQRKALFPQAQSVPVWDSRIREEGRQYLQEIKTIFDEHETDCKIVISPQYHQMALGPRDLSTLQQIFGRDRVFDYSTARRYTENIANFYDCTHHRPFIANAIMRQVYKSSKDGDEGLLSSQCGFPVDLPSPHRTP